MWESSYHDRARGNRMHEFEREKLSCFDESLVVQMDEAQRKEGKQIREHEVQRQIRIGIGDQIKPVRFLMRCFVLMLELEHVPVWVIVIFISNTDVILWPGQEVPWETEMDVP